MGNGNRQLPRRTDATLVDVAALEAALHDQAEKSPDAPYEILDAEPLLSSYLHGETLKLLGKLALSGANSDIIRGVANEIHCLLGVAAGAIRHGYRGLIADFLPDTDEPSDPAEISPGDGEAANDSPDDAAPNGEGTMPF